MFTQPTLFLRGKKIGRGTANRCLNKKKDKKEK
jgi:hypothetical protein